jgi:cell division protein FtsQ
MKTWIKILILIPLLYVTGMPVVFSLRQNSMPCSGISVDIADSSSYHFITKRDIRAAVTASGKRVTGIPVKDLALGDIEEKIASIRQLKKAEVYTTVDGVLHIYADQRNPIVRIIAGGGDYFMDGEGVVFPKRGLYTPRLHIAGGNIRVTGKMLDGLSVFDTSFVKTALTDIYMLVNYIRDDSFWSAQIDQVWVDEDDQYSLVPRMGKGIIHLGSAENFEGKLRNLEAFYEQVMPEKGWNTYSVINLEYKNQIVCKKRNE